jgi:hypothetical protein
MRDLAALVVLAGVYAVALTVSALAWLVGLSDDRPDGPRKGTHPCR